MSNRANVPSTINASMGIDEFIEVLASMGQNVTPQSALRAIKDLPSGDAGVKLAALCVYAACSVKKACDPIVLACNLSIPESWKVEQTINFSMFAMVGHLMMMLPDQDLTRLAKKLRPMYRKSIGNADNLKAFGQDGVVPGKPSRTSILREWSVRVSDIDPYAIRKALGDRFPEMVKPVPGVPGARAAYRTISFLYSSVTFLPLLILKYKRYLTLILVLLPATRSTVLTLGEVGVKTGMRTTSVLMQAGPVRPYVEDLTKGLNMIAPFIPNAVKDGATATLGGAGKVYTNFKAGTLTKFIKEVEIIDQDRVISMIKEAYESASRMLAEAVAEEGYKPALEDESGPEIFEEYDDMEDL